MKEFGGRRIFTAYKGQDNEQVFIEYMRSDYGDITFKDRLRHVRDVKPLLKSSVWKQIKFSELPWWYVRVLADEA